MSVLRHQPQQPLGQNRPSEQLRQFGTYEKLLLVMPAEEVRQVKDRLEDNFFDVHAVLRMSQAIEQILQSDFDAVIIDTSLPDFPLPTFYSAVERIRPGLLARFIFLIQSGTDPVTTEFIERVDGLKVWRPVEFTELFQTIEIVRGRKAVEAVAGHR